MGLDDDQSNDGISPFEQEMQVRIWWQISTLDILSRHLFPSKGSKEWTQMAPDIRLPRNVDDADLHPNMVKPPVEYAKATEMVYVLMKYEGAAWGHRKRTQCRPKPEPTNFQFSELQNLLEQKYLQHCDPQIPLHVAAQTLSRSTTTFIQYMTARINVNGRSTHQSRALIKLEDFR